ncbi:damage-inducible protein [Glycomyces buryatensis]|uniref:Damage-inducible protein n=2 Tax=Glycomyces buryatensis TaxID=2570927 RepID=A0A4S8QIY3_9ACTN|nr:damage-inducible protein [Glycomyces buryatensis]
MLTFLKTDPQWAEQFSEVWMYGDAPIAEDNKRDLGIDLVARDVETGGLCAIQCKFYESDHAVSKADVDSFFAASGKGGYTRRMIISTTERWGPNAEEMLTGQQIPVSRIGLSDLEASPIDWDKVALDGVWTQGSKLGLAYLRDKKQLRRHQEQALAAVFEGFAASERGKLIMACGTGKTFTSLKIAEHDATERAKPDADPSGLVLFLVPSIALLSQTLREWTAESSLPLHSFAVCSDVKATKQQVTKDLGDQAVHDLALPATTDPAKLIAQLERVRNRPGLTVVFSTYHSIDVIAQAQQLGLGDLDLVLCDEAHRTTGVTLAGDEESNFVRVHDGDYLRASRRLYMTATPRIYMEHTKDEAKNADAVLCSMDNEALYGPEFHKLGFGAAVERDLLTDYKVMILAVDESQASAALQRQFADENMELALDDAAKIIGCWNGMAKRAGSFADGTGFEPGEQPMRRAVAFSRTIAESEKIAASFASVVNLYREDAEDELSCELDHVDGGMNTLTRNRKIDWLKADPGEGNARILTNARCLSEGVDVPDLDAVLFLHPRNSHVDVIQSVGRVMRKAPGKKYGYIILPVAIPAGIAPDKALADNKRYKVVWEVLRALRAHDDRMDAHVNQIDLNKNKPKNIMVGTAPPGDESLGGNSGSDKDGTEKKTAAWMQDALQFEHLRDAIYARIVKNVGQRTYWEAWANDIARIAQHHVVRIQTAIELPEKRKAFDAFLAELRSNLNPGVSEDDAIDMLSQHIITKPVFDALFADYAFASHNPVSKAMDAMLAALEDQSLEAETAKLEEFYKRVRVRAEGIDNHVARQTIIKDLYEQFFEKALPKTSNRLGIVYTPTEVVDFIIRAVDQALGKYFNASLSDEGVHVIDPFTGTGTFITRLLQSGLIKPEDLLRKYASELHANEIVLLAYYIAAVNIEAVFHDLAGGEYKPFEGIVLTDTFQLYEGEAEQLFGVLEGNSERAERQKATDIRVVIGNPPYSVGQGSQNDDNQNLKYEHLDARIKATYVAMSNATNKNKLYDSYIRAFRWASDRIRDKGGVICYVSNGGYIDNSTFDGFRKSLVNEFDAIYCYNLRGNLRAAGEQRRKEKENIFGDGARTTIAVIILIKGNKASSEGCELYYRDIGDYLTEKDKLAIVSSKNLHDVEWEQLAPSVEGDWINHRDERFGGFRPIGDKGKTVAREPIFGLHSLGVNTNRDAWVTGFSAETLADNVRSMIDFYNQEVGRIIDSGLDLAIPAKVRLAMVEKIIDRTDTSISWSSSLISKAAQGKMLSFDPSRFAFETYRPFNRQYLYFDNDMNHRVGQIPRIFPTVDHKNFGIYITGTGSEEPFSVLAVKDIPDLHAVGTKSVGPLFARYSYRELDGEGTLFDGGDGSSYERVDNITDGALRDYQSSYNDSSISKDDIFYYVYGLLHSPEYRTTFEADLKKSLPRIPKVVDFQGFAEAGRALAELHLGYESAEPYAGVKEDIKGSGETDPADLYRVSKKMKFRSNDDRIEIDYNQRVTLVGIPEEVYRYQLGARSAIEWVKERYWVKTDKDSGIVNDPNDWSEDPRYIVNLLKRIVTVSLETMKIVDVLPPLDILPEQ